MITEDLFTGGTLFFSVVHLVISKQGRDFPSESCYHVESLLCRHQYQSWMVLFRWDYSSSQKLVRYEFTLRDVVSVYNIKRNSLVNNVFLVQH